MVHTNRGKRLFIFVFYVFVYLYLCTYFAASGFAPCMGLRVPFVLMPFELILTKHNILIIYNYI
jgi:hypothetical protein